MMPKRAPLIHQALWNRHKREIISVFLAPKSSLIRTREYMRYEYGFDASIKQYTTQLKLWRIGKNTKASKWKYTCYKLRKRALQGKRSMVLKHKRKLDDKTVEKGISRNVSLTDMSTMDLDEDIPTPSDIEIVTPPPENDELFPMRVRIDNLPWIQFKLEVQSIVWSGLATSSQFPIFIPGQTEDMLLPSLQRQQFFPDFNMMDQASSNLPNCRALEFASLLAPLGNGQNNGGEIALSRFKSYIIDDPNDTSGVILNSPDVLHTYSLDMSTLLNLFVFLSTNNVLDQNQVDKGLSWIIEHIDPPTIICFSQVKSLTMKIFLRKLFLSAVRSRNQPVARALIRAGVDVNTVATSWLHKGDTALGIAVCHGDIQMVQLLCEAGADLVLCCHNIEDFSPQLSLWHSDKLDILHLLLCFGADPEVFISDRECGFPLVNAASNGSLEAVHLLLRAGANVNNTVSGEYGTAVQAAAAQGHHDVVLALIHAGADVNGSADAVHDSPQSDEGSTFSVLRRLFHPSLQTPLQLAAKANDTALVKTLLRQGAQVAFCPASSYYIHFPVELALIDDVMCYTDKYSFHGPNTSRVTVATAIQYAVWNENNELVSLFLSRGANVDSRVAPAYGDTPLQIATGKGNLQIASLLLEYGADVNASPAKFNGRTAIQAAAESGNLELCSMLLESKANLNAPAGWCKGLTAMQAALLRGHIHVVRFLYAAGADVHAAPAPVRGLNAVQAASFNGDINILKEALWMGAQANAPAGPMFGRTALEAAVSNERIQLLEVLLNAGADVNGRSFLGCTALQSAVDKRWRDGIEYLLRWGADPNLSPDCPGDGCLADCFTALGWCIYNDDICFMDDDDVEESCDMISLLLANGADPNLPTSCHENGPPSALHHALEHNYPFKVITLLLNAGAAVDILWSDKSALPVAVSGRSPSIETVQVILDETAKLSHCFYSDQVSKAWQEIHVSAHYPDSELIDILLNAGADINTRNRHRGGTLLQNALKYLNLPIAKFLLEKGADTNSPSTDYTGTPLQEAIKNELTDLVYTILEHDVDINAPPARRCGATALQAAALTGQIAIAKELLKRGADVAAPAAEENGRTALDGAAEHGRLDMLQLLLNAYGDRDDLLLVCHNAARFAGREDHVVIADWLRQYRHS